jgi:ABC-type nitrate/sulfonate/bicarbonate transport system substrate-binding protein
MIARREFVEGNPDLTRRVARSYVRAVHRYKTDPDFVVSLLRKYSLIDDEAIARLTHAALDRYMPEKSYPTVPGMQRVVEEAAKRDPNAARLRAEDLLDSRWIAELDRSGFIDDLYARGRSGA